MIYTKNSFQYKLAIFVLFVILLRISSVFSANLSYFFVAIFALRGNVQAIQALALSWLLSMLNGSIVPEASLAAVGRYAVFSCAALSVFFRRNSLKLKNNRISMVNITIFLGVLLVVHSLLFSPYVDVSILKVASWVVVTTTLFSAWSSLNSIDRKNVSEQIFGGLVSIMLFSIPMLLTSQGYSVNETGFQGILNHPQGFGPVMALLGVWVGARILAVVQPSWSLIVIFLGCLILVVLSEARTGGLALVIGLAGAISTIPFLSGRSIREVLPGFASPRLHFLCGIAVFGLLIAGSMLTDRLSMYLDKRGDSSLSLGGAYQNSRGELINSMLYNIDENPIFGIGFGIASYLPDMIVIRDPIFDLPVSATIEKGVLPIALVEELGFLGSAFVLIWFVVLIILTSKSGVTALVLVFATLLLNFGESTFFSPSGLGLLPLILISWAATDITVHS